jgi:hypothetical protein
MIIKKFSFENKNQIWRLHISESDNDKIVIETREMDTKKKEIFFHCLDLQTGRTIFKDLQFDEKSWIGIETIHNDVVILHKYANPSMPGHKSVIGFNIIDKKILWQYDEFSFRFVLNRKVYVSIDSISGEKFYAIDFLTGEIENLGGIKVSELRRLSNLAEKDYSSYKFPEIFKSDRSEINEISSLITNETKNFKISGNIEFINLSKLLFLNYHYMNDDNKVTNLFKALDKMKNKVIFTHVLNKSTQAYVPDSFFIYKHLLLLLKEKKKVEVFEIK